MTTEKFLLIIVGWLLISAIFSLALGWVIGKAKKRENIGEDD